MPRPLAGCSETLKRFNEALQRFIEALSNLTRPGLSSHQEGGAKWRVVVADWSLDGCVGGVTQPTQLQRIDRYPMSQTDEETGSHHRQWRSDVVVATPGESQWLHVVFLTTSDNNDIRRYLGKSIPECLHSYRNVPVLGFIGAKHDGGGGAVVKVVLWSRGGVIWRSQVGANSISIPTPPIWRYLGIKLQFIDSIRGAHTIAGRLKWEQGAEPPHFNQCGGDNWSYKTCKAQFKSSPPTN